MMSYDWPTPAPVSACVTRGKLPLKSVVFRTELFFLPSLHFCDTLKNTADKKKLYSLSVCLFVGPDVVCLESMCVMEESVWLNSAESGCTVKYLLIVKLYKLFSQNKNTDDL